MKRKALEILERAGIKATPNRTMVLDELLKSTSPQSLIELETSLETLERSSVLRALNVLLENDLIHMIEDGRGISKYEVCRSNHHKADDMHPHFYCHICGNTFCLTEQSVPHISLPEGFEVHSVNYMIKGICAKCKSL